MNKKALGTMSVVVTAVVLLIVGVVLLIVFTKFMHSSNNSLTECPGYCAIDCSTLDDVSSLYSHNPLGDDWCVAQTFTKENVKINNKDVRDVMGADLGLICCVGSGSVPETFLSKKDVVEGGGSNGGSGGTTTPVLPPRGEVYFQDNPMPSDTVKMYSNMDYVVHLRFDKKLNKANYPDCSANLLFVDDQGKKITDNIIEGHTLFNCDSGKKDFDVTVNFPSKYEGQNFKLIAKVNYNSNNLPAVYNLVLNIRVTNPIVIGGLANAYEKEKSITLACKDLTCIEFKYSFIGDTGECTAPNNMPGSAYPADMTPDNKGYFKIPNDKIKEYANDKTPSTPPNLCVYARTKDDKIYARESDFPVKIDRTDPIITAVFKPARLITEVTCKDVGGAGCTGMTGYYYIRDATSFLGALINGVKEPKTWCPKARSSYSWLGDNKIPQYSSDQFKVLCVRVEDNAGNYNTDILLTYNAYTVLQELLKTYGGKHVKT